MSKKRFIIDVEEEFQENAVFFGDEFLCFEDDSESLVSKLNEQQAIIEHLKERLYDFEKRKIIEESEIDEDVIPKIKLLRTELFGEKYD